MVLCTVCESEYDCIYIENDDFFGFLYLFFQQTTEFNYHIIVKNMKDIE